MRGSKKKETWQTWGYKSCCCHCDLCTQLPESFTCYCCNSVDLGSFLWILLHTHFIFTEDSVYLWMDIIMKILHIQLFHHNSNMPFTYQISPSHAILPLYLFPLNTYNCIIYIRIFFLPNPSILTTNTAGYQKEQISSFLLNLIKGAESF